MRIYEPLDKILNQETKIKIIRFLFNTNAEWSGRQIGKEINVSPATGHKALRELYSEKVILLRNAGVTHLYRLNEKNYIVKNILSELFRREKMIPEVMSNILLREIKNKFKGKITSILLFGSVAKRKEKPVGDIDLMVITKRKEDKERAQKILDEMNGKMIELFNRRIEPYLLTIGELRKKRGLPVIKEIKKTGRLIWGKPLLELL